MALILCIETSTTVCSVALALNGECIHSLENHDGNSHATHLTLLINQLFKDSGQFILSQIDAIAVSEGPGSYTGLRIGASTAKGICYAIDKPLIAIQSLRILSSPIAKMVELNKKALLCPLMDARRMEVYASVYNFELNSVKAVWPEVVDASSFSDILDQNVICFFGYGAEKCKSVINHPNARWIDHDYPLAKDMCRLAQNKFNANQFVNVAYMEPFYLKEFMATIPKNKIKLHHE